MNCLLYLHPFALAAPLVCGGCAGSTLPSASAPPEPDGTLEEPPQGVRPSGPGIVQLHVTSPLPGEIVEHTGIPADPIYRSQEVIYMEKVRPVCAVPGDALIDGRAGHGFSIVSGEFPQSPEFWLTRMAGDVNLIVEPGNNARLTAGRVLLVPGIAGVFVGAVWVPLGYTNTVQEGPGAKAASVGVLVGGAGLLAASIALMATSRTKIRFETLQPVRF